MLPRTAFLERAQGLRCGYDPNDTGVTQDLRTGWLLDHAVKIPLNTGITCLKTLLLCRRACGRCLWGLPFLSRGVSAPDCWHPAKLPQWEVSCPSFLVYRGQWLMCSYLQFWLKSQGYRIIFWWHLHLTDIGTPSRYLRWHSWCLNLGDIDLPLLHPSKSQLPLVMLYTYI